MRSFYSNKHDMVIESKITEKNYSRYIYLQEFTVHFNIDLYNIIKVDVSYPGVNQYFYDTS